jgi:hypothetical protein
MASAGTAHAGISELALDMLRQTRPWVLFLGILSFIAAGLMLLAGIFMAIAGAVASAATSSPMSAVVGLVYIPLGVVYVYPGLKLVKYGGAIGRLMQTRSAADLEDALGQQKSMWKFSGIAAIVMIVLYVLIFIAMFAFIGTAMKGLSS